MGEEPRRGRGRPAASEGERRGENLTLRVRTDIKEVLQRRAAEHGRSLSAEAALCLEQALLSEGTLDQALDLAFGRQLAGILLLVGKVMRETGASAGFAAMHTLAGATDWIKNFYAFDQATQAASAVFEAICPEDDGIRPPKIGTPFPGGLDLDHMFTRLGAGFATTALTAIATEGDERSIELAHLGSQVRPRLGPEAIELIKDWIRKGEAHHG